MAIKGVGVTMALCGKSTEFKQNCAVLSSARTTGKLPEMLASQSSQLLCMILCIIQVFNTALIITEIGSYQTKISA